MKKREAIFGTGVVLSGLLFGGCSQELAGSDEEAVDSDEAELTGPAQIHMGQAELVAGYRAKVLFTVSTAAGRELWVGARGSRARQLATFPTNKSLSVYASSTTGYVLVGYVDGSTKHVSLVNLRPSRATIVVDAVAADNVAMLAVDEVGDVLYTQYGADLLAGRRVFVRTATGSIVAIPTLARDEYPQLSPDGKTVVFNEASRASTVVFDVDSRASASYPSYRHRVQFVEGKLLASAADNSGINELTVAAERPWWSANVRGDERIDWKVRPDGKLLAFAQSHASWSNGILEIVDAKTGASVSPAWTPGSEGLQRSHGLPSVLLDFGRYVISGDGTFVLSWVPTSEQSTEGTVWLYVLSETPQTPVRMMDRVSVGTSDLTSLEKRCSTSGRFFQCNRSKTETSPTFFSADAPTATIPEQLASRPSPDGKRMCGHDARKYGCVDSDGSVIEFEGMMGPFGYVGPTQFFGSSYLLQLQDSAGNNTTSLFDPKAGPAKPLIPNPCPRSEVRTIVTSNRLFLADCTGITGFAP